MQVRGKVVENIIAGLLKVIKVLKHYPKLLLSHKRSNRAHVYCQQELPTEFTKLAKRPGLERQPKDSY